jgi:5'-3' exonuclease
MGIKNLNRFFKDNASESINFIELKELSGKKIAVDISIYMHKYASENALIENMYLMLSVFRHYNVIPIFIFDGKSPDEKKELLVKRKADKVDAQEEYNNIKNLLNNNADMSDDEKKELKTTMVTLKRTLISLKNTDIENVKDLIRAYGATYYDAHGEADELCAMLTIKGKVWACLSEDMDMFVYGCPRVIRYLSLPSRSAVLYDLNGILKELGINQKELREICILSGTDYNIQTKNLNLNSDSSLERTLYDTLRYFQKYCNEKTRLEFYDWLIEKTDYINDYNLLIKINKMFELNKENIDNNINIKVFENINIENGPIQNDLTKEILKKDGFIFPQNF